MTKEREYVFEKNRVVLSKDGAQYHYFDAIFDNVERFIYSLGARLDWFGSRLVAHHKDFDKLDQVNVTQAISFEIFTYETDDISSDQSDISLSLGKDIRERIDSIEDLKKNLETLLTSKLPVDFYLPEEQAPIKREIFIEKLKHLRISEDEFIDALGYYES